MSPSVADIEALGRLGTLSVDDAAGVLRRAGAQVLRLRGAASRPLPPHVKAAVLEALEEHDARPSPRGIAELREAIATLVSNECATSAVDPETEVLVTHGAMHALSICFRALLAPGDKAVIPAPAFFFGGPVQLAGAEPVYAVSLEAEGWRWDLEAIEAAVDRRTRALVLCNPSNPTGYLPSAEDIAGAVDLAQRHDLLIVTDESYERYVYDGASITSVLSIEAARPRTILVRSMSKSLAMSSWRIGFLVGPQALIAACTGVFEWECLRGNHVAQRAAAAAISGPREWLADIVPEYERNRDVACAAVEETAVLSCVRPQACPFLFINLLAIRSRGGRPPEEQLLEAGIPAVPGSYFQAPGYARLPFGGEPEALNALAPVLREWCDELAG